MSFDEYFFVAPSFRRGVSRVFDLGATLSQSSYLYSDTPAQADQNALESDWAVVAKDYAAAAAATSSESEKE